MGDTCSSLCWTLPLKCTFSRAILHLQVYLLQVTSITNAMTACDCPYTSIVVSSHFIVIIMKNLFLSRSQKCSNIMCIQALGAEEAWLCLAGPGIESGEPTLLVTLPSFWPLKHITFFTWQLAFGGRSLKSSGIWLWLSSSSFLSHLNFQNMPGNEQISVFYFQRVCLWLNNPLSLVHSSLP